MVSTPIRPGEMQECCTSADKDTAACHNDGHNFHKAEKCIHIGYIKKLKTPQTYCGYFRKNRSSVWSLKAICASSVVARDGCPGNIVRFSRMPITCRSGEKIFRTPTTCGRIWFCVGIQLFLRKRRRARIKRIDVYGELRFKGQGGVDYGSQ